MDNDHLGLEMYEIYKLSEAKGSLVVICYLAANGRTSKYGLIRNLRLSKEAIDHAVTILCHLGLCELSQDPNFPFAKRIGLTSKGAKLLVTQVRDLPAFWWTGSSEH